MKVNKNIMIAILLLSVFAVGTMSFVDTVEAAKWKKFDSGTFTENNPDPGYKKKMSYVSDIKDSNIRMKLYHYKSKNNKKVYAGTIYLSKIGTKIRTYTVDPKGKKSKPVFNDYKSSSWKIKDHYKGFLGNLKNVKSTYLTSLKSTGTSKSGSSGSTGLRQRYVPAEYGYVNKWNPNKYNPSTGTYGGYDYMWDVIKQGHYEYY